MRARSISFLLLIVLTSTAHSQTVQVVSFQHAVRWLSEANFPDYLVEKDAADTVLSSLAQTLRQRFHTETITLPPRIDYRYISGFGKAGIKIPKGGSPGTYQISLLSFLTRATTGYAVWWKMEAVIQQNGQTIFENKTEHELEYFSPSGYLSSNAWMKKEDFSQLFSQLLNELLQTGDSLSQKIIIGSAEQKEAEVKKLLSNPEQYLLKTSGGFLQGNNFIVSLQHGNETTDTIMYRDGWDASTPKIDLSEASARLLHGLTGLNLAYDLRSKEKRFGRLQYNNGNELKLRMEWMQSAEKTTDGQTWSISASSPMMVELYDGKELTAYYTYIIDAADSSLSFKKLLSGYAVHRMEGFSSSVPVSVIYDPGNDLAFLRYGGELKLVMVMQNINPGSRSFSGYRLSKNKTTLSDDWRLPGKPKFKGQAEWYHLFYDASLTPQQASQLLQPLLTLFFGMGNAKDYSNSPGQ